MQLSSWASDPQYVAFEQAIIDNPDDDTPRLVLADWLEEHGDEHAAARAELIRVQTDLDRLPPYDRRRIQLTCREQELLRQHEKAWLLPLANLVSEVRWQRGFVHRVKLGVRQFMNNADELFRQAPILDIQLLRINHTKMPMAEVARCPHFSRIRGLRLPGSNIGDEKLAELLSTAKLDHLEVLDLSGAGPGRMTLRAIASGSMPRLRVLDLSDNQLVGLLPELTMGKVSFSLRQLSLASTFFDPGDRSALFRWPALSQLERLDLANHPLRQDGVRELVNSPHLSSLRQLRLAGGEVGVRGTQMLCSAPTLANLEELDLNGASIRRKGLAAILSSALLTRLEKLALAGNGIGDGGVTDLADWPGLARLKVLDLEFNAISPAGVQRLLESPHIEGLVELVLSDNRVGDEGALALASCPRLGSLQRLGLSTCSLSSKGIRGLLESAPLAGLAALHLGGNRVAAEVESLVQQRFPTALDDY